MNEKKNETTVTEAEYRDGQVEKKDAATHEADGRIVRRVVGTIVIENDATRPLLVRRLWEIDESGAKSTVHESTHYYADDGPTDSDRIAETDSIEWQTENTGEALFHELRDNLTVDAHAEVEGVISSATTAAARRKLGLEA